MSIISRIAAGISDVRVLSVRDVIWQYTANFGVAIFGALFILVLGRFIGAQDFGIYAIAAATPAVVSAVFDYRLQEVSVVLLNDKSPGVNHALNIRILYFLDATSKTLSFAISVAAGYLILALYGFGAEIVVPLAAALSVYLAKAGNATAMGVFRQAGSIKTYAILQSLDWATRLSLLVLARSTGPIDIAMGFYVQLVPAATFNILTVAMSLRICRSMLGSDRRGSIGGHVLPFVRSNRKLLLSSQAISSVDAVVKELDTLVCGAFLPPQGVAVYKMAKNIASIAWKFVDPIFVVILPGVSRYISEGRLNELSAVIRRSSLYLFGASVLIFLASWAGSVVVSHAILGESYWQMPFVYPFISLWIVVALPFIWTHSVAIASGNAPLQAFAGAIGNLTGLATLIAGAAAFGVYGAAFGLSVAYAAPFALSFYLLVKKKIIPW